MFSQLEVVMFSQLEVVLTALACYVPSKYLFLHNFNVFPTCGCDDCFGMLIYRQNIYSYTTLMFSQLEVVLTALACYVPSK